MDKLIILILFITYTLSLSAESKNNPVCTTDTTVLIPRQEPSPPPPYEGEGHRSQQSLIYVCHKDHVLFFGDCYTDCIVELYRETDDVIFSGIINTYGFITLPQYLSGIYEIRLIIGNIDYIGELEL